MSNEQSIDRGSVAIACRTLGFAAGAQMLSGVGSALPGEDIPVDTIGRIVCNGDEDSLTDCTTQPDYYFIGFAGEDYGENAVAVMCNNPSGTSLNLTIFGRPHSPACAAANLLQGLSVYFHYFHYVVEASKCRPVFPAGCYRIQTCRLSCTSTTCSYSMNPVHRRCTHALAWGQLIMMSGLHALHARLALLALNSASCASSAMFT